MKLSTKTMISHFALNANSICSNTSLRKNRPDALSSLMERSLGCPTNGLSTSFLHSNDQLVLEQQQALARLEQSRLLSLHDQMKDAINSSSHSQRSVSTSKRSGQKRSAKVLGPSPSSEGSLLLKKQERLQNVLRQNHREIMANAALGLISNAQNKKTRHTSPQLSPVSTEFSGKSRLNHLLLLQQQQSLQSSPLSIMEPMIHGNYAAGYELKNSMPYLAEDDQLATYIKMQQENELQQELLQKYAARQDLYGSICQKIQEEKEDKKRQIEKLTQHEHILLLLQKKQEEEQQQKLQENLRQEQLYSLVQQRQIEEQQRELQLRMATMERLQQVQREARRERSGTY